MSPRRRQGHLYRWLKDGFLIGVAETDGHRYVVQADGAMTFDSRLAHRYVIDSEEPARLWFP